MQHIPYFPYLFTFFESLLSICDFVVVLFCFLNRRAVGLKETTYMQARRYACNIKLIFSMLFAIEQGFFFKLVIMIPKSHSQWGNCSVRSFGGFCIINLFGFYFVLNKIQIIFGVCFHYHLSIANLLCYVNVHLLSFVLFLQLFTDGPSHYHSKLLPWPNFIN